MPTRLFLSDIDLSKNQLLNYKFQNLATPPTLAITDKGFPYFDTADGLLKYWNGTAWITLSGVGITNLSNIRTSDSVTINSSTGSGTEIVAADGTNAGVMTTAMYTKLSGITPGADVTNATTVAAAGAVMQTLYDAFTLLVANADNSPLALAISTNSLVGRIGGNFQNIAIDSDLTGVSAFDDTIPSSKATKAYIDSAITGQMSYQGGYDAATNIPDLDTTPILVKKGWTYTVTASGLFFTEAVQPGDMLVANIDGASSLSQWTVVNKNIPDGVAYKYATNITGDAILTTFTITHNLGTTDITTFIKDVTTNAKVETEEIVTNSNVLTLNFNVAPADGKVYRVTVIG